MRSYAKTFYKMQFRTLTVEAKIAQKYVNRICKLLSKLSGRKFYVEMNAYHNVFEGHIVDSGKCIESEGDEYVLSTEGDDIGMIFWGGHFNRKKDKNALSHAWISLLEDCIGNAENGKIAEFHNLTDNLKCFGPDVDLNCKTVDKLEEILKEHTC